MLYDYPIDLVLNLYRAAVANRQDELNTRLAFRKAELKALVLGVAAVLSAAVRGKGELLENWLQAMDTSGDSPEEPPRRPGSISPATRQFFGGAPVIEAKA